MKSKVKAKTVKMAQTAVLTAIVILMAFTPIGYLKVGVLEITFIMIPVALGAILLGPSAGLFLGTVFGLSSFIQCFGLSAFGSALLTINPFLTFITCMIPRMLMGWLTGVIFNAIYRQGKSGWLSYGVASLAAPILNTLFFMTSLCLCFYNTDFIQGLVTSLGATNIFVFVALFVGINGLVETIVSIAVTFPAAKALSKVVKNLTA